MDTLCQLEDLNWFIGFNPKTEFGFLISGKRSSGSLIGSLNGEFM